MGAREFFNRGMIVDAARSTVAELGFQQLTVRRVAERLQSSTAPIFKQFATMDALERAVAQSVLDELKAWATRPWPHSFPLEQTNGVFLNLGIGIAHYAQEHPKLCRYVLAPDAATEEVASAMRAFCLKTMQQDTLARRLPSPVRTALYDRLLTYFFGLASRLMAAGAPKLREGAIESEVYEVGTALIFHEISKLDAKRAPRSR